METTEKDLEKPAKSHRPKNRKFYQQRLPAWHPIATARNVFPFFFVVALIFIPIGGMLIFFSSRVKEYTFEYTHCTRTGQGVQIRCSEEVRKPEFYSMFQFCPCSLQFNLEEDIPGPIYLYYGLSNFYQNHRRYVISRDDKQLNGQVENTPSADCDPFRLAPDGKAYAPCGAIAMSIFNDTISLKYLGTPTNPNTQPVEVPVTNKGIAWHTDVTRKFGKPPASVWPETTKPFSWPKTALQRSADAYSGDEELIVWMRPAAFSTFRKLHRRVLHSGQFSEGLPAGTYQIDIGYAYPVTQFGGSKRVIITTANWLGGRNPTLGIGYIIVGVVHLFLGITFILIHIFLHRKAKVQSEATAVSTA